MKTQIKLLLLSTITVAGGLLLLAGEHPDRPPTHKAGPPPVAPKITPEMRRVLEQLRAEDGGRQFHSFESMHEEYSQRFQTTPGFGLSRVMKLPKLNELSLPDVTYTIKLPDLISLDGEPVVYRSSGMNMISMNVLTNDTTRPHIAKRALTVEEAAAIERLRAGEHITLLPAQVSPPFQLEAAAANAANQVSGLVAIGALRANSDCAKCHGVKEGTLLGAFSYQLIPKPAPLLVPALAGGGE